MALRSPFDSLHAWLIDMDGVIYRGDEPTPAAAEFITALQAGGHPFLFVTNNATKTAAEFAAKLARMDIHVDETDVFTSSLATADHLRAHLPPPRRAIIVGGNGVQQAMAAVGYQRVRRAEDAELVVVGLDTEVTYAQLAEAALAISAGRPWFATNPDLTLPSERGDMPGAGALLAFLSAATGRTPVIIGKPEVGIFEQALARLGVPASDAVMLGDRLETDILGGKRAGLRTICILTGIDTRADAEAFDPRPDWIVADLREIAGSR